MTTVKRNALTAAAAILVLGLGLSAYALAQAGEAPSDEGVGEEAVYSIEAFGDHEALWEATAYLEDELGYNPHGPRPGSEVLNPDYQGHFDHIDNCGLCHGAGDNGQNVLWCTSCHLGLAAPDGWLDAPIVPGEKPTPRPAADAE